MDDAERPDDGYAIPIAALNRPGGPRRSVVAGLTIVVVLSVVGVGARLVTTPKPSPSAATPQSAVAVIATASPERPRPLPTPIDLVDGPIQTDPSVSYLLCGGDESGEVAGVQEGTPFIRDLDSAAVTVVSLPAGFAASECNWVLSSETLVGTIYRPTPPETTDPLPANLAFVYNRATGSGTRSRPLDGFEALTIRGIAGRTAYGEMLHSVPCCIQGGSQIAETRAITIDLASGAVTDITPSIWPRGLAVSVRVADGEQILLSAETALTGDGGSGIPVFIGAAVVDLTTGGTTMLRLGLDVGSVEAIAGGFVVGQYVDTEQAFVLEVGSSQERPVPTGQGATVNRCSFAIPALGRFACVEGVPFFRTRAFTFDPASGDRTDLPITILAGQELRLTAAGITGVLAGTVTRNLSNDLAFAYDAASRAPYRLAGPAGAELVPEVIAGRWILTIGGEHAWRLP